MKLDFIKKILVVFGALFALNTTAADTRVLIEGIYYQLNETTHSATVTYGKFYSDDNAAIYFGDLVIPETIEYGNVFYTVNTIGSLCFYSCTELTSIELPSTLTTISESAFQKCSKLTSISVPEGVTKLGSSAFSECTALTSAELPSTLKEVASGVFSYCKSLKTVNLPEGITEIPPYVFLGTGLEHISLPSTLEKIYNKGFYNCLELKDIVIPDNVSYIGEQCFELCKSLKSVELGMHLRSIDIRAFVDCPELETVICRYPDNAISTYTGIFSRSEKVRILVPNALVSKYGASQAWSVVSEILPLQCATPIVAFEGDNMLVTTTTNLGFTSKEETIVYSVEVSDIDEGTVEADALSTFGDLLLTYDVKARASVKDDDAVEASEETNVTLCWLDHDLLFSVNGEVPGTPTAVGSVPVQRPVLVTSHGGTLTVSGLHDGEILTLYALDGRLLGSAVASGDSAELSAASGQVVVVRVGNQAFKVRVR